MTPAPAKLVHQKTLKYIVSHAVSYAGSRWFHPGRISPFIVSLFQAVLVFKRICRWMRARIHKKIYRQSEFKNTLRKSNKWTIHTKAMGRIIKVEDPNRYVPGKLTMSALLPSTAEYTSKGQKVKAPSAFIKVSRKKRVTDALFREVDKKVQDYDNKMRKVRYKGI